MTLLEADRFPGIVDADRSRVLGDLPSSDNILLTDGCDLESMLIHSPALDKVLTELGSSTKIRKFEARHAARIGPLLADLARPLGAVACS